MQNIKSIPLTYGLINAAVQIAFTFTLYLGGVKYFLSPVAYVAYLIPVLFALLGAAQQKKLQGGYIEFREALKTIFQILVTGALVSALFEYILFNYIDPAFNKALMQATIEKVEKLFESFHMPQEKIDQEIDAMMNANNYSVGKVLLGLAYRIIGLFALSLVISVIIKKKRPPFENSFNQ